ncbi:PQ loop repeat-domain-containing protein [Lentinula raphanica]|uniref:PQ loop repeat-domain-containing protein n=1 Tax=Lentinula raphanica TaxID=153919 RepID=A0AA38PHR7_9AGAR|nr:PQ loop repeat-domain-containing protein [Lentinula raphanica]KAJ3842908.1 PQ loop repeat-domain-containing protein [Lentinula raphanica]KAJ3977851.1 PQ loop repeat-domain-containing protein [Lentinula raphanica]
MAASFNDALSSILGWVSIACWIVVYSPQIYENYSLQSGEGLSLIFVYVWLLGDITNMTGAILAGLLPTVIILGVYYTLCDLILLFQVYYYRWKARKNSVTEGETTPLLNTVNNHQNKDEPLSSTQKTVIRYVGALLFVVIIGVLAWWISSNIEIPEKPPKHRSSSLTWAVQILGWTSAICYLGSRIPQIIKNFGTRCEGLAPALFFFSILGNATYSLSICVKSMEREYLITNASWLAGSALTIFLDLVVLSQFSYFRYMAIKRVQAVLPLESSS